MLGTWDFPNVGESGALAGAAFVNDVTLPQAKPPSWSGRLSTGIVHDINLPVLCLLTANPHRADLTPVLK